MSALYKAVAIFPGYLLFPWCRLQCCGFCLVVSKSLNAKFGEHRSLYTDSSGQHSIMHSQPWHRMVVMKAAYVP